MRGRWILLGLLGMLTSAGAAGAAPAASLGACAPFAVVCSGAGGGLHGDVLTVYVCPTIQACLTPLVVGGVHSIDDTSFPDGCRSTPGVLGAFAAACWLV